MADPARARKIADRIKVVVAEYLEHRIKDERLGFVTITDARVTGDLQHASVFYTVFGDDQARTDTAAVLEANKGRIRSAVGKAIGIRLTPTIEFIADALPEGAAHLEDVLAQTRARDAELAAAAAGATYAGDADPYRKGPEASNQPDDPDAGDNDGDIETEPGDADPDVEEIGDIDEELEDSLQTAPSR